MVTQSNQKKSFSINFKSELPLVAVVGRPNVGKSTLVNRILGKREAIVESHPGVTRDPKKLQTEWNGKAFELLDTGGWLGSSGQKLDSAVSAKAEMALEQADLVLVVCDATVGITDEDEQVAKMLRKKSLSKVICVSNKVDSQKREVLSWEFVRLGLGQPRAVSALHGRGIGDLLDEMVSFLPDPQPLAPVDESEKNKSSFPAVAIIGRPNVGKSTLFNKLVGSERSITHDMPGTTRDSIDTLLETDSGTIRLIDTAGMRKKSNIGQGAEYYSLVRALQALDQSDVALLVIDSTEGVTHQDQRLAERIDASGSPVVVLLNKWDLISAEDREKFSAEAKEKLSFWEYAPVLKISALSGKGVNKLIPSLQLAIEAYNKRIPTAELNRVIQKAQMEHPAPKGRILYATQGASNPPTFTLFSNSKFAPSYLRYLERKLRESFDFGPTPLKIRVRQS